MDQLFSILDEKFKTNILTIENLKQLILDSNIIPTPIVTSVNFIHDWKIFIENWLTKPGLKNQSKYASFLLSIERIDNKKRVVFRAKKYPHSTEYVPRAGLKLLKDEIMYEPVGCAEYTIERINFDETMKGVNAYLSKIPVGERREITTSWERLRYHIESLPRRKESFPKMKINEFPKQKPSIVEVPEHLQPQEATGPGKEITGELYSELVEEGDVDMELSTGMDIIIYTDIKKGRPWAGRIIKILEDQKFELQWFVRKTVRSRTFYAQQNSSGPELSIQENDSVMFWQMSENRQGNYIYLFFSLYT